MTDELAALHASVFRLAPLVAGLDPDQVRAPAYPTEWTIADTLSHIGSGAVIAEHSLRVVVDGGEPDPTFNQSVWDEWNAKQPEAQVADALAADQVLIDALAALDDAQRAAFHFAMGPFALDFAGFVALRLNEHVVHTWDVEVALDPTAVITEQAAGAIIDNLGMIVGFAGQPTGTEQTVRLATTGPDRGIDIELGSDGVLFSLVDPVADPDVELTGEAVIRLVYGRLDPEHTPPGAEGKALEELRKAFPGF